MEPRSPLSLQGLRMSVEAVEAVGSVRGDGRWRAGSVGSGARRGAGSGPSATRLERSVGRWVVRRPVTGVELVDHALRDALQHLLGEDAQQLPTQVQRLEHRAVLVRA